MANPNIVNVATINGATAVASSSVVAAGTFPAITLALSSTQQTLITCGANTIIKINSLVFSNSSGSPIAVTASIYRGSIAFYLGNSISVPANSTLVMISKDTNVYLVESDALQVSAGTASSINVICSYDTIS